MDDGVTDERGELMETLRNVGLTILLFLVSWGFYTVGYCDGLESDARARARATVATDPVPAPDWIASWSS